ncbi:hypothetical protein ABZZ17_09745 [Streptomyces sp. NPDC006512]|uniref:hypothetical protein n=1 Tax=Streptomyces sp. NPDC006512 TaxID=3154307 RepID=UPI00339F3108
MPEEPAHLVDAIEVAVRDGDDHRIALLLDRFRHVADLSDLIRLRCRLTGATGRPDACRASRAGDCASDAGAGVTSGGAGSFQQM